ncbi:divalent-cation tolerance protein CutA [Candidatus Magnetominusculus dajiuhuensis]|uniref:divalent-cation tolerance protein CutA n=1 Tax=Candidatus Magnetominusculus dajiuhuensis TaxID=3137712 RepID=UPI003B431A92
MDFYIVLVTVPDETVATAIADALVSANLAKCVNIVHDIKSIFLWEGKVQDEQELLLIIKAKKANFSALMSKVKGLHPYTVPEIIALPIVEGNEEYMEWLNS